MNTKIIRLLYSALLYLLTPAVAARLLWRSCKAPAYRRRWRERFASYTGSATPGVLWVHAVSVGEAEAAFPLIQHLLEQYPDQPLLVTSTTPTGSERIRAVLGARVRHVYLPYDLPDCVQRFQRHFQPTLAIMMETEIWPNLFHSCRQRGIPLFIVNARLSRRSLRGYKRLALLTSDTLSCVTHIAAQTRRDARRFRHLGVHPEQLTVAGNLKFDLTLPAQLADEATRLRRDCFLDRSVWVAASTHEGEEEQVLRAFRQVQQHIPQLLLAIAPRHPERFTKVTGLASTEGFVTTRRSRQHACTSTTEVYVIDTMGELKLFYAAAEIAFIGGSLVATGGHNVIEAAATGTPVLSGPHIFNFQAVIESLEAANGLIRVNDWQALAEHVIRLLEHPEQSAQIGTSGRHFVTQNQGALTRISALIRTALTSPTS